MRLPCVRVCGGRARADLLTGPRLPGNRRELPACRQDLHRRTGADSPVRRCPISACVETCLPPVLRH
eukprot:6844573-Lingulodinium_polyedra.AAC.1